MRCKAAHSVCSQYPGLGDLFGHTRSGHAALGAFCRTIIDQYSPKPSQEAMRKRLREISHQEIKDMQGIGPNLEVVLLDARRKA